MFAQDVRVVAASRRRLGAGFRGPALAAGPGHGYMRRPSRWQALP
jgi:hypothetical protein